jgi:hypothetical protein
VRDRALRLLAAQQWRTAARSLEGMPQIGHLLAALVFAILTVRSEDALAGVTINYEGRAKDGAAVERTLAALRVEAGKNGWSVGDASANDAKLERIVKGKNAQYRGLVRGVVLRPSPNCEPFYVQFDSSHFMQDFVKTQFAGADIHVKLIEILKAIRPLLTELMVFDEGEYWETGDGKKLQGHFDKVDSLIAEMKRDKPKLRGPVTLPSGRIVDLMN